MGLLLPKSDDRYHIANCSLLNPEQASAKDKACVDMTKHAQMLSRKYHNDSRWLMHEDEIFGELMVELALSINRYLYCNTYKDYLIVTKMMMHNRICELTGKSYGGKRKNEYSAQVLSEDHDREEAAEMIELFIIPEFLSKLSQDARRVVSCIVNPDNKMDAAVWEYVEYRRGLYKNGAGIRDKMPAHVIAQALDLKVSQVSKLFKEIRKALKQESEIMASGGIYDHNYEKELVTQQDVISEGLPLRYVRWSIGNLKKQATFRGLVKATTPDIRSVYISLLQEDDEKRGVPALDTPLYSTTTTSQPMKVKSKAARPAAAATAEYYEDEDDDEEDEDEFVDLSRSDRNKLAAVRKPVAVVEEPDEDEEDEVDALIKRFDEPLPEWLQKSDEEKVVTRGEPSTTTVELPAEESTPVFELNTSSLHEMAKSLMQFLRAGEAITIKITKLSDSDLNVEVLPLKVAPISQPLPPNYRLIGTETGRSYQTEKPNTIVNNKVRAGSREWKQLVCSKFYLENEEFLIDSPLEKLMAELDKQGIIYERHDDKRTQRNYMVRAFLAYHNEDKYREGFKTTAERKQVEL